MTIEEAIKVLDMLFHYATIERSIDFDGYTLFDIYDAFNMTKKALKERNQIVRCKDCKYYSKLITGVELCNLDGEPVRAVSEDDFCSKGESTEYLKMGGDSNGVNNLSVRGV